jgi:cytochrome b
MAIVRDRGRTNGEGGWVKVWDPLLRLAHWGLAAAVTLALVSSDDRRLHEAAGYAALGVVGLRIVWGFVGPAHARFTDFVRGPGTVLAYLRDVFRLSARRHLGHNPAGGAMILALFALVLVAGVSGWMSETDRFFGVTWVEDLHSGSANLLLFLIIGHVVGVIASSMLHGENLVRAMITGRKPAKVSPPYGNAETEEA